MHKLYHYKHTNTIIANTHHCGSVWCCVVWCCYSKGYSI